MQISLFPFQYIYLFLNVGLLLQIWFFSKFLCFQISIYDWLFVTEMGFVWIFEVIFNSYFDLLYLVLCRTYIYISMRLYWLIWMSLLLSCDFHLFSSFGASVTIMVRALLSSIFISNFNIFLFMYDFLLSFSVFFDFSYISTGSSVTLKFSPPHELNGWKITTHFIEVSSGIQFFRMIVTILN